MFSQSTEVYDFIYSEFKDFAAEADEVARLLKEACPSARRILDVGCGTGRHAEALIEKHGYHRRDEELADALEAAQSWPATAEPSTDG